MNMPVLGTVSNFQRSDRSIFNTQQDQVIFLFYTQPVCWTSADQSDHLRLIHQLSLSQTLYDVINLLLED